MEHAITGIFILSLYFTYSYLSSFYLQMFYLTIFSSVPIEYLFFIFVPLPTKSDTPVFMAVKF